MAKNKTGTVPIRTFLEAYKFLEEMLRQAYGSDMSVLEYENKLAPEEQSRMAMCRRIRNYAQHHTDAESFVGITEQMFRFVTAHAQAAALARNTADKIAKKVKPLTLFSNAADICAWRLKYDTDFAPVVDTDRCVVGFADDSVLLQMVCKSYDSIYTYILTGEKLPEKLNTARGTEICDDKTVSQPEFADFLDKNGTVAVVRDADRKYLGILSRKVGNWF